MIKKNYFTLIEISIALVLSAILLSVLFGFFVKISSFEKKNQKFKQEILSREHVQLRLSSIFSQIVPISKFEEKSFNLDDDNSLNVIFDNGIDPDPLFSGPVKGKIFQNQERNLILTLYPIEKGKVNNKTQRTEVLCSKISSYKFLFFSQIEAKEENKKKIVWIEDWPKKKNDLPPMIKLILDNDLTFAFFIPTKSCNIEYKN
ncbi:MAG: type II secretion system protein [Chlamydiae bacterium]|nr:type II secretion system protein [Chlamydiota bacterium]